MAQSSDQQATPTDVTEPSPTPVQLQEQRRPSASSSLSSVPTVQNVSTHSIIASQVPQQNEQPSTFTRNEHVDPASPGTSQQTQPVRADQMLLAESTAISSTEQALWKVVRAANVLKSAAEQWNQYLHSSASLRRHLNRCSNTVTALQKASLYATHIGTTAKVVGGLVSVAGLVSQNPLLRGAGSKIWKSGCAVKFAGLAGSFVLQIWNNGFQATLSAYLLCLSGLVQNMMLFRSALEELQVLNPSDLEPGRVLPLLLLVCPEDLFTYACHIVRTLISHKHYSAFNDFMTMALSTVPATALLPVRVMHEIESFQVFDCLSELPTPLQYASAAAHAGKEIMDFFSSLNSLQGQDFLVLRNLLHRLRATSSSLMESIGKVPLLNIFVNAGDSVGGAHSNVQQIGPPAVSSNERNSESSSEAEDGHPGHYPVASQSASGNDTDS
ncbi:hypothetical protein BaRGS_00018100 [Batillaria attramentaria]|uniref:Uncharacterized protein n=1 Tax=Batillaria attramentaria TaxID=370345 RepID=A0ABD0KUQ7_9CAEN